MRYLNFLVLYTQSEFLSDLKYVTISKQDAYNMLKINDNIFFKADYELAAKYLLTNKIDYKSKSIREIKRAIIRFLLQEKKTE